MVNPFLLHLCHKHNRRQRYSPFLPRGGNFGGHIISMEHSYRHDTLIEKIERKLFPQELIPLMHSFIYIYTLRHPCIFSGKYC